MKRFTVIISDSLCVVIHAESVSTTTGTLTFQKHAQVVAEFRTWTAWYEDGESTISRIAAPLMDIEKQRAAFRAKSD